MVETKRKTRDHNNRQGNKKRKVSSSKTLKSKSEKNSNDGERRKRTGPRLPNALRKELELMGRANRSNSDDEEIDSDDANDVYEYEEAVPEEESMKNRRFDPVENFEYELPNEFKDENVASEEDDDDSEDDGSREGQEGDEVEQEDGGRHARMLQEITGLPVEAFEGKKRKNDIVLSEVSNQRRILPSEPLVKRNREAPTLYFDEDVDLGFSTVGAIASEFEPRTEFEKKIAALVNDNEVLEAHKKDGARLLELNKISVEDVKDHQDRLAKMRTLLFLHEMKAKRIKKIKSKTYHRLLKKDGLKAAVAEMEMNPEAAKEFAMKQEFKRAEERLTLKHKNSSKWAKRILKRGLDVQDEGTRAAIAEQLHQHALLTRKMKSMKDNSSSDDSSDEDYGDDISDSSDQDRASKLLEKAKEKTLGVINEDGEVPKSGVLSLPFMVRGLQKRKETADEEAKLALEEYESSLKQLEGKRVIENVKKGTASGRRIFGAAKKHVEDSSNKIKVDNYYGSSDSEDNLEAQEDIDVDRSNNFKDEINFDPDLLREESEIGHDSFFKSLEDIVKDPGPKTTYEVAIFAADSWKKMSIKDNELSKCEKVADVNMKNSSKVNKPVLHDHDIEDVDDGSDSDSEVQMVDGILSSGTKSNYELPSQADLIRRAFAGDDVEDDFEKDKKQVLNEENPEPEKPVLVPGWGQWTNIQQKKGLPSWMLQEHDNARKKREEAVKKRKDAHLKHVIISEKLDKKAANLHTKTLPYPYTSKEVFEQSIRMPIGPEFNPVTTIGALNRPEVVKKVGVIIKPIKFEDVNPHERREDHNRSGQKQKKKKSTGASIKRNTNKIKVK
ncbi:Small-subunit processome, Utp14 protein [Actinidia chinensis var. chinensis]|uniref:Small-subunit processome, Utp14 protein n=1 Tax=Actinidia chinensis var. chinensis TaxID=1590841 RepID=A0A2R6PDX6_ACTCC|nr:Small-subunit processome, Utp14 protein [Actinidia chinensis var. chinensis]